MASTLRKRASFWWLATVATFPRRVFLCPKQIKPPWQTIVLDKNSSQRGIFHAMAEINPHSHSLQVEIIDLRYHHHHMEVSKNKGCPKMDGLEWKTLFLMDDLGGKPTIFGNIHI